MKQIQKCPHCHKDSVFSHNICPNCGFESKYEERGEPDYKLDENGNYTPFDFQVDYVRLYQNPSTDRVNYDRTQ